MGVEKYSQLNSSDIHLFMTGQHFRLYEKLGAHPCHFNGQDGYYFAVWAPKAQAIAVIGDFNQWDGTTHPLFAREDQSGIWEGFIAAVQPFSLYKFRVTGYSGGSMDKADPFGYYNEIRPATASITCKLAHAWNDEAWMTSRRKNNSLSAPWSVYEVHLLSWMRPDPNDETQVNTYEQAIELLVPYVQQMGFTHVELMPIMEHPNDASWGYQGTGFFAANSRFGTPEQFMQLIDAFHQAGIGVILDWVPSHFPYDGHGLYMFDGTHQYENADMRRGYHPDWNSYIFDYGKPEVKSFLTSSARFWLDKFHADGLRVDGVSSLLILSYSRSAGQWEPNIHGGDENLEAIAFLQDLNNAICHDFPDAQVIAEESTAWEKVSGPSNEGGLGFGMKWMMGWMHDSLEYFKLEPRERKSQQPMFMKSMEYFYSEKFMLALSHDEVVYGKKPMIYKMPGDEMQRFANLRALYGYMFTHPGAKLLFMGDEFGSTQEWNFKSELPWWLLQYDYHRQLQDFVRVLNNLLKNEPALYENQFNPAGFEWLDTAHPEELLVAYRRRGFAPQQDLLVVLNLGNEAQRKYKLVTNSPNNWTIVLNSDHRKYGGMGTPVSMQQGVGEVLLNIPALSVLVLKQN